MTYYRFSSFFYTIFLTSCFSSQCSPFLLPSLRFLMSPFPLYSFYLSFFSSQCFLSFLILDPLPILFVSSHSLVCSRVFNSPAYLLSLLSLFTFFSIHTLHLNLFQTSIFAFLCSSCLLLFLYLLLSNVFHSLPSLFLSIPPRLTLCSRSCSSSCCRFSSIVSLLSLISICILMSTSVYFLSVPFFVAVFTFLPFSFR